jgi:hypothetical protein
MADNSNGSNSVSSSGNDLDVTRIPNEEVDKLASAIETFYKQDGSQKSKLAFHWERVMRFLDGDQWLNWGAGAGGVYQWNTLVVSKANEYIPRPVTNYLFDAYQTLKSYLTKTKPRSSVRPNTQTYQDKGAAKVANLCIEANYERLKDQENYEYAASVLVTYGTVFKKTFWDTTAGSTIELPSPEPMVEGMVEGQPETIALGEINTVVKEPYCMVLDPLATDLHTARWIMEYAIQPLDWIKEMYGKVEDGYTGRVDEVKSEAQLSGSLSRFYQLKNSSGAKDALGGLASADKGSANPTNCAVVKEYYERPTALNPKGRMVVVANGICLYAGASPCEGPDAGDWHPYSECRWEIVPGRFWGKSPLDAACELQKRINSIDATIMLVRKTMAIPQKLVPAGSGIEPGQWTGRPGQQLTYRADAGEPKTVVAAGVDTQVFREREQCVEDIKTITGAIDILKGDRPPGVNAASALSLLYEVGTGKIFPVLDRWKRFIESDQKKELRLLAKHYREPRPAYIALLKAHNKELAEAEIDKFLGQDLLDNCNVIVEAGSNVPKLEAMKQMRLQEAAQTGAIDLMNSPENRAEYQRQMGIVGFDNDVSPAMTRAEWENDCLDNILQRPDKQPVVLADENHDIHISVHFNRVQEPAFMELDQQIQEAYLMHIEEHKQYKSMQMQAQAMEQMATGMPPEQTGAAPTGSQGKGVPASMQEAMNSADLPPGEGPR